MQPGRRGPTLYCPSPEMGSVWWYIVGPLRDVRVIGRDARLFGTEWRAGVSEARTAIDDVLLGGRWQLRYRGVNVVPARSRPHVSWRHTRFSAHPCFRSAGGFPPRACTSPPAQTTLAHNTNRNSNHVCVKWRALTCAYPSTLLYYTLLYLTLLCTMPSGLASLARQGSEPCSVCPFAPSFPASLWLLIRLAVVVVVSSHPSLGGSR